MGSAQRAYRNALGFFLRDAGRHLLLTPVANLFLDKERETPGPGQSRPQAMVLSSLGGTGPYPDLQHWLWPTSQGSPDLELWVEFT